MSEKKSNRRLLKLLSVAAVLLLLAGVLATTGVFASLFDTTSVVGNKFEAADVSAGINNGQRGGAGTEYTVSNDGNLPVFVRVKIIANWVDENGNPMMYPPEGSYHISTGSGWARTVSAADPTEGYWYYDGLLEPGATTEPLITGVSVDGGEVELVLLSETIQTNPADAVSEAWDVAYRNGTWTKAN